MIKLILGPMRSGKSLILLREAEKLYFSKKNYVILRPENDTRAFLSRSFTPTVNLNLQLGFTKEIFKIYDFILVDEFHLHNPSILKEILNSDKNYIISGLNCGYDEKTNSICLLRNIKEIFPFADEIIKLNSICEKCGSEYGGLSLPKGKVTISDDYIVVCKNCLKSTNIKIEI